MDYFNESHEMLRQVVRDFVRDEILPYVDEWEEAEIFPRELYVKAGDRGLLGLGFDDAYGGIEANIFHHIVLGEEYARSGAGGIAAGLGSHGIGLPPIQKLGTEEQKARFIPPVLSGEKIAALAITEADAGSDVASLRTRAVRTGDHYVVNGSKTFITSGTRADFLITAVRTGGPGHGGISLLVIESDRPGVMVSKSLKKMGWRCSDTAELAFADVAVPVENLIGGEGQGFAAIMRNFQQERLSMAVMGYGTARVAYEQALEHARNRIVFGKPLIAKQVIRHKLAEMLTRIEVAQTYVYSVGARMQAGIDSPKEVSIAKNFAVTACDYVMREATQILGGMGFMRGVAVERLYRDARVLSIGGGAHEIMNEIICKYAGISASV